MRLGAIEAGGTKMVLAIGNEKGEIEEKSILPTLSPAQTIPQMVEFFREKKIDALGIGAFGPVDVNKNSATYGRILNTPKLEWKQYPLLEGIQEALQVPVELDTDVNCACLGEMTYGCAKGLDTVLYLTVGTGIGAGIAVGGQLLHGMLHPEAGHILIQRKSTDYVGSVCPYHENCLEGLASGKSIQARWGKPAAELAQQEQVWELESEYLSQGIMNYILTVSPQKIILGGGVLHQQQLFPRIHKRVPELLNHYYQTKELQDIENYIVPASLQDNQGVLGALCLAQLAYRKKGEQGK